MSNRLLLIARLCLLFLTLGQASAAPNATAPPPILVGGSADALHNSSITDAEIAFKLIFNEMLADINESFTIKIYDSNDALMQDFKDAKIEAIYTSSLDFLELDELVPPDNRYAVQHGPSLKQRYLILVRREDRHLTLADLRGHKASLATSFRVSKRFLDVKLMQQGLPVSEEFFSEVDTVRDANTAVVDLFFSKVDVALVLESNYEIACELNPQLKSSLVILDRSEPMICDAVGMRYDFPQSRIERIEPQVLNNKPEGRLKQLLDTFRVKALYRMDSDMLKEIRQLEEDYQTLIKQSR